MSRSASRRGLVAATMLGWGLGLLLATPVPAALRFQTLTTADGLTDNSVRAIVEDTQGFLWLGSEDGLNRFDGLEFKSYRASSLQSWALSEDFVNRLLIDRKGQLWIATFGGGLNRYDAETGAFTRYRHDPGDPASISHDDVSALYEDAAGTLWVGTRGGGLHRIIDGRIERVEASAAGASPRLIEQICGDGEGGLWVATQNEGLLRYAPASNRWIDESGFASTGMARSTELSALLRTDDGSLWVGTRGEGLARRDAQGRWQVWMADGSEDTPGSAIIHDLAVAGAGRIWVAGNQGLDRFDPASGRFESFRHVPGLVGSLPYDDVQTVMEDSNGTIWVGTGGAGLARHTPEPPQFSVMDLPRAGSDGGAVWSVMESADGAVWAGTLSGGVLRAASPAAAFRPLSRSASSLDGADVRGLQASRDGSFWVGTRQGLFQLDASGGLLRHYVHDADDPASLSHDFVRPLLEDREGRLWIGTYGGGLNRFEPGGATFVHYRNDPEHEDSLSDDRVYTLMQSADGAIWIGTHGGGLNRLDPSSGAIRRFRHRPDRPDSLPSDRVLSLQQDARRRIWIGTAGGLSRWDAGTGAFIRYPALGERSICGILEDPSGAMWISRIDGVLRFDPATESLREYALRGLIGNAEFNCGAWGKGASGRLYFGGVFGVVVIDPSRWAALETRARPVITSFRLFNRPQVSAAIDAESPLQKMIGFADEVVLRHDQNVIGFDFAALGSAQPLNHEFRYRMQGLDDRWIQATARERLATFTQLPAGRYRFEVQLRSQGTDWLPDTAAVDLRVVPAPWRSAWAYAGYATIVALVLGQFFWQSRQRRKLKRKARRLLEESEERLSLALWGSGDTLFDWDLQKRVLVQVGGERSRGFRMRTVRKEGEDLRDRVHPDDRQRFSEALERHLDSRSASFECDCRLRQGEGWAWRLLRGRVVARDDTGKALRLVGMQKDIGPLKAVEEELRSVNAALDARVNARTRDLEQRQRELQGSNQRLEESLSELQRTQSELIAAEKMAALGQLVAGVAHEVNTPLGVALTASSHLHVQTRSLGRDVQDGKLSRSRLNRYVEESGQIADMIERNLGRAAQLVHSFKQVSVDRSSDGRRVFVLKEFLDELLFSMESQWKRRPVDVVVDCDETLQLDSFPGALGQIIANLLQNALVHGFDEAQTGSIRIAAKAEGDDALELTVRDDGKGIKPDVLSRIFEPFFTTRRGQGGTGLGLHISFNLVTQKLGGTLSVRSQPGAGTEFLLRLPRVAPENAD